MLRYFRSLLSGAQTFQPEIDRVNQRQRELARVGDKELKTVFQRATGLPEIVAVTAVVAARLLGLSMFDVQLHGAMALANGKIAEMQTDEGKTLAAAPAVAYYARSGQGVHVLTVNDYLARRDAGWMGPIYDFLGLSVGCIQQEMSIEQRKQAYACDITYATANEVGFDYLRDQLALYSQELLHRPFSTAVVDEVDSLLIDAARIPLVVAGGETEQPPLAGRVDRLVRNFQRSFHYAVDEYARNVSLTDDGILAVEKAFGCTNLFADENLPLLTAVQNAVHAHALLHRDVDYLVKDETIVSIDEFKGSVVRERRWPASLHTALEVKEGVAPGVQGKILGSMTVQSLMALYPNLCGMTGTTPSQAEEFRSMYGLEVEVIPTNRPMIRVNHPDVLFQTKPEKERAVIEEIRQAHQTGRPVLVGTVSVQESERLSAALADVPHEVLNARDDEREAAIIAQAGSKGAVTISTNMAGRGTDIQLGEGVAELGGLYVIGTNRHESRRIDNQLRGRAGRQGDPGSSRFFVSLEDDLLVRYGITDKRLHQDPESIQRLVEGQNLDIRIFLRKFESAIEGQRQAIQERRHAILTGETACRSELERLVSLRPIDELWAEHLGAVAELREGTVWVQYGGRDPLYEYLKIVHHRFQNLWAAIDVEIPKRLADAAGRGIDPSQRGATWTYLANEQPFGSWEQRFARGVVRKLGIRRFKG